MTKDLTHHLAIYPMGAVLGGSIDGASADPAAPEPVEATPQRPAPSQWQADADELFGRIRAALRTPIVNSIWRAVAGQGQLERAWAHLEPQVPAALEAADALQQAAFDAAREQHWPVVAGRVLALAASSDQ